MRWAVGILVVAVLWPLAGWLGASGPHLLGSSGVGRGEFESWAFLEWWIPRLAAFRLQAGQGIVGLLRIPYDLGIGNCVDVWLLAVPLKSLLGAVGGHNARVAAVLTCNALGAWVLCREAAPAPAWLPALGAVALALNPITLWDVAESRFAQALLASAFLYVACLLRLRRAERVSWRLVLATGGALAVTATIYWYWALFLAPLGILLAMRAAPPTRALAHFGVAALLVLPLAAPFASGPVLSVPLGTPFPTLEALRAEGIPTAGVLGPPGPGLIVSQSVDLADPLRPVGGPALPWMWVLLAALGAWSDRRVAACAGAWWIGALGPYLRFRGHWAALPLPFQAAYQWAPLVSRFQWPGRFLALLPIALVVLSLPVLARWAARRPRWVAVGLGVLAVAPALHARLLPLPVTPLRVPALYRDGALRGGVVEASFDWNSSCGGWLQSWHGQKVLGSRAQFPPWFGDAMGSALGDASRFAENGLLRALARTRGGAAASPRWTAADVTSLRRGGYRWLVIHRAYGGAPLASADGLRRLVQDGLDRAPDREDGEVMAWDLDRP